MANNQRAEEKELGTKTLQIQTKRYYMDVKENNWGRFFKLTQVTQGGYKMKIIMIMSIAREFKTHLQEFADFYASLGPHKESPKENNSEDVALKSAVITTKDTRRYYLDLKENNRGRFLRVAQTLQRGPRVQIAIPAQGLVDVRDALTELLDAHGLGEDEEEQTRNLPQPKSMKVDNKMVYFDVGANRRGTYLRISEVRQNMRMAITIPDRSWEKFRDVINEIIDGYEGGVATEGGSGGAGSDEHDTSGGDGGDNYNGAASSGSGVKQESHAADDQAAGDAHSGGAVNSGSGGATRGGGRGRGGAAYNRRRPLKTDGK